jgi:hypothetical protein
MQRLSQDDFIVRSRQIHGKKYDYSRAKIVSATTKVVIVCPKHGPFEQAPYVHYLMGCGCPPCGGRRTLTLRDMHRLAEQKGGECLAAKYVNNTTPLRWRCSKGHIWEASPYNVGKPNGTWCPYCAGVGPRTLDQMVRIAKERGGLCLSKAYSNLRVKLLWRCNNNHDFWMTPSHVIHRNGWCPRCTKYVSERICRGIFEALFKEEFPKAKPDWLTSSRGNRAELDGYCARLKLAFEHNGEQHYRRIGHFHRNDHSLLKRKQDDASKLKQCGERGIQLFVVPYTVRYGKIEDFIRAEAARRNIPVPRESHVGWKSIPGIYDPGHLSRMQNIACDRGGLCLSKTYINNSTKLKWRCAEGHGWEATPAHIAMGGWCPRCCGRNNPRSLEHMKAIAKERGGECLSKAYRRNEVKLKWKCAEGHIWSAASGGIISGRWCQDCGGSKPKTMLDMRLAAEARGGKCLSQSYKNSRTKLEWCCADGHTWWAQPSSILAGTWCRECKDLHSGNSQRLTLQDMHAMAAKRGGKCVSTEYRNTQTKLLWCCADGHEWAATPGHIRNGRWCRECKRLHAGDSQRLSIQHMHKMAQTHSGQCLSLTYRNTHTALEWQCSEGHRWSATSNKVQQGHWCRVCRKRGSATFIRTEAVWLSSSSGMHQS